MIALWKSIVQNTQFYSQILQISSFESWSNTRICKTYFVGEDETKVASITKSADEGQNL